MSDVQWAVMRGNEVICGYQTQEEAEAYCQAREVSRLQRKREWTTTPIPRSYSEPYYVASRRVTEWWEWVV